MSTPPQSVLQRLRRFVRRLFGRHKEATQLLHDEILYLSSHTQSLGELLTLFPQRVCAALGLSSFHVFLREGADFALQRTEGSDAAALPAASFPVSSSLAVRMRRDRKPALFLPSTPAAEPDGWQLLATEDELLALHALDTQVLLPLSTLR